MEINEPSLLEVDLINVKDSNLQKIVDSDEEIERIVKALSSDTRRLILSLIKDNPLDVSNIAESLKMTEANISAQIKKLEKAGLINCDYASGSHGVRKISSLRYHQISFRF